MIISIWFGLDFDISVSEFEYHYVKYHIVSFNVFFLVYCCFQFLNCSHQRFTLALLFSCVKFLLFLKWLLNRWLTHKFFSSNCIWLLNGMNDKAAFCDTWWQCILIVDKQWCQILYWITTFAQKFGLLRICSNLAPTIVEWKFFSFDVLLVSNAMPNSLGPCIKVTPFC
jgi:hypothetical protein